MGSMDIAERFPAAPTTDNAGPIGGIPLQNIIMAMCIGRRDGILTYVEEVPVRFAMTWRVVSDLESHCYRWWRLEAKVAAHTAEIQPGDQLIVAEHPYSRGWVRRVPFKNASKKGGFDRTNFANKRLESMREAIRAAENASHDYWEKGNYLTAGISDPELPFNGPDAVRNVQRHALLIFGLCADANRIERELVESEEVRTLLRATENNTLRFWAPHAKLRTRPKLFEEVKAESAALMILSIRQALAGPHRDSRDWIDIPVIKKIDQIYRGHLNRSNRVLAKEYGRVSVYDDANLYGTIDDYGKERL